MIRKAIEAAALVVALATPALALANLVTPALAAPATEENDYPTSARVDYVIACMGANGETRDAMTRCSCSIDKLASLLSYDRYVQAETILSMRQGLGQGAATFRNVKMYDDIIADLRRAQAEAEVVCFK